MDFDFALLIVGLTAVAGVIWIGDRLFLLPTRARAVETYKASSKSNGSTDAEELLNTQKLLREPIIVEYAISFFPVLVLVLMIRSFVVEPYQIPTGSMIPTLQIGDFILVNKYAYGIRLPVIGTKIASIGDPENGDVMVFIPPHEDRYFIKRVIGIPGDSIRYEDKTLYLNGIRAEQKFVAQLPPGNPEYLVYEENFAGVEHLLHRNLFRDKSSNEWVVPEGYYFMMGDNRDRSADSRFWGLVPEENIRGKAFAVWMHKEPGIHLPEFDQNRWIE